MQVDEYKSIARASEGVFKDRGSKFLAYAFPVETEVQVSEFQKELRKKHFDARHHCYAFRLGAEKNIYRAGDDGEPANSSGPPILGQIRSTDLSDILIVVVRYFGGTKLGVPGLINAYKTAAAEAIANAEIITKTVTSSVSFSFNYQTMNDVMRLIKEENLKITEQDFQMKCKMTIEVRLKLLEKVKMRLEKINSLLIN